MKTKHQARDKIIAIMQYEDVVIKETVFLHRWGRARCLRDYRKQSKTI